MNPTTVRQPRSGLYILVSIAMALLIVILSVVVLRMFLGSDGTNNDIQTVKTCTVPTNGHPFIGGVEVPESEASAFGAMCK